MANLHWTQLVGAWSVANRFWIKVDVGQPDDCWPFLACKDGRGYGRFGMIGLCGEVKYAHIIAYELVYGPVPDSLEVLHSCNYKPCCNYYHLSAGTREKNMTDALNDRLFKHGEVHYMSKNSDAEVQAAIDEYLSTNITQRAIAAKLGVRQSAISRWVTGDRRG